MREAPIIPAVGMDADTYEWTMDRFVYGFRLPEPAHWFFRLWGIRHIRFGYHAYQVFEFAHVAGICGLGTGHPNRFDMWVLFAIWKGWC